MELQSNKQISLDEHNGIKSWTGAEDISLVS